VFTGIVQAYREVLAVEDLTDLRRLQLDLTGMVDDLILGASIAVNGVCLTVTAIDKGHISFDVIRQTMATTTLGNLVVGQRVNVERSYRVGDEVGGHIVSGHIATKATLARVEQSDNLRKLWLRAPQEWLRYLLLKGFVAIDGASLTISDLNISEQCFAVSLIPETIERTNLGSIAVGEDVNLEVDSQTQGVITTVERLLEDPEWRARFL